MQLLDRQTGATPPLRGESIHSDLPAGRIQLRLRANGELRTLPPGKATIGSSPRCNVRIEQPGVQPLHCLIVESVEGLRVRSWSADTTLNGVPFEESALFVGDCLTLGPVELVVVGPIATTSSAPGVETLAAEPKDVKSIRTGRDQARTRSRQLLDALRQERNAHQELCRQVTNLQESHLDAIAEQNEINGKLESCLCELAEALRQLGEYQSVELERQRLAEKNEQLGFELGELSARVNELTYGQSELENERQALADGHASLEEQHRQLLEAHQRVQSEFGQSAIEKAAADEQNRQLFQEKSKLQDEIGRLTDQRAELEAEREGLRQQNDQLMGEVRQIRGEQGKIADERSSLCEERSELRQENEALRVRIAELNEENSAMAVSKLTLVEDFDALNREAEQLRMRVAELSEENAALAAAKTGLADGQAELIAAQKRVAELEREIGAAAADHQSTSSELYRALLQVAEFEEREVRHQAANEAYASLNKERDYLEEEVNRLKEEIGRLGDERREIECACQTLSTEVSILRESQHALAEDKATLARMLDEAQEQLGGEQPDQTTLSGLSAELQREVAAKLQAEAELAAAIAEGERRLDEQEGRFAEQAQQFAEESRQFNEQSQQHAEQMRAFTDSINLLERQLMSAGEMRDSLAKACEEAQVRLAQAESRQVEQSGRIHDLELQLAAAEERAAAAQNQQQAESARSSRQDASQQAPEHGSTAGESAWTPPASLADAWRSETAEVLTGDSAIKRTAEGWTSTAQPEITVTEPDLAGPEEQLQPGNRPEICPAPKQETTSFIERYSHLFAEDAKADETKPTDSCDSVQVCPAAAEVARPQEPIESPKRSEEEDSIEQYMAKLLQRVRGDSEGGKAAREQPMKTPLNAPPEKPLERATEIAEASATAVPEIRANGEVNAVDTEPAKSSEMIKRRGSSPAPASNLNALRALANETARLAISRHELRKLRRNAVTKVIVSTLAGVTSLWLMLDSPDWRSVHFITACGALLVAAYWAGETYRTLINSMRIAAYEGPEEAAEVETPALPIDVEEKLY